MFNKKNILWGLCMLKRIVVSFLILIFVFIYTISVLAQSQKNIGQSDESNSLTKDETIKIESWIEKNVKDGKIPGASVVIVKGDKTIYTKGFGYADIATKKPVTGETLFELGSTSKAFTALGILKLQKEGYVDLDTPVTKYLPWFHMKFIGEHRGAKLNSYVDITIRQLLYHTSGIPFKSIGDIPIDEGKDALLKTVKTLVGKELDSYPGSKFEYATINYDILGLVIQNVSGESFEQYMKKNILTPLGLKNTYISRNEVPKANIASGYKLQFLKPIEYNAPIYRGNAPAGYFISNSTDIANWIKLQLGIKSPDSFYKELINVSHIPDRTVAPNSDGSSYALGWSVFQDGGGMIAHGGSNPNYSSYILFRANENLGVGVLTNLNSSYTEAIAKGVINIITGEKPKSNVTDAYVSIDNVSFAIVLISIPAALASIYFILVLIFQVLKGKRKFVGNLKKMLGYTISMLIFIAGMGYCMYSLPDVLYDGLPWSFIKVWAPQSLIIAMLSLFCAITIFSVYYILATLFPKKNDKALFIISTLSLISGLGNAIIIFIINEALNRNDGFQTGLVLFFVMGIVIYVYGQRLVRTKLLRLTNELVYSKRINLISIILNSSYEKIEQLENGKIQAGLNNDTEVISNFANVIITAVTSLVTIICCFIYLGIINLYGLMISILVIVIATGLYFLVGKFANKLWEETRDIQNVFFKFINSLSNGFKELKMKKRKRDEFFNDMQASCRDYRDKRIMGDLSFANVFVIGELLFTLVIGVVAFIFPVIFEEIQTNSLRSFIFIILYITGPVHGVLDAIPQIIRVKISYKRLAELENELKSQNTTKMHQSINWEDSQFELKLSGVEYGYKNSQGEMFIVGPIDCSFKSGEITFITGGNGSGKTTLAKLITGLYAPSSGDILLNGSKVNQDELGEYFSTIFSDYYLFEKLYGIDHAHKDKLIEGYMDMLHLKEKVQIVNGSFTTINLSTGQRKRLALLLSFLDNKPIFLFDEWAADQDPSFRKIFYEVLLPELKIRNKCIIAITHDDRYFDTADKVIKMCMGKIENPLQEFAS